MNVYEMIDKELKELEIIHEPSVVLKPVPIKIKGFAKYALQRFEYRNATKEMAQHYINAAVVMIKESKDKLEFISEEGTSVVLSGGQFVTSFSRINYTLDQMIKMQVVLWKLGLSWM